MRVQTCPVLFVLLTGLSAGAQPASVPPSVETQPVVRGGTDSQDVALWVNSGTPEQSLLLVADSVVGLVSFGLNGVEQQALLSDGVAYGVDVRDGFTLPGGTAPLVVVANGTTQSLTAYMVDPLTLQLRRVDTGNLTVPNFSPRTVTLYRSAVNGVLYAFMSNVSGTMQQVELRPGTDGGVQSVPVRNFAVGGAIAGAVADDQQGYLFVVQQNTGIWRYDAEPGANDNRISVASAGAPLTAPLGGVSLYSLPNGTGYLLAASAGGDQIVVYDRRPPHASLGSFAVVQEGGIDAVDSPVTVVATSRALGPNFPAGLVAVHDAINDPMQNDKLVSWLAVANAFNPPLAVNQTGADGGTPDGGTPDGGTPDGGGGAGGGGGGGTTFPVEPDSGCGCAAASVPGTLLFVLAGLALLRRRRRQA
jgi:3-phytase